MKMPERTFPEYAENIIVGVIYMKNFQWYVTLKDYWIMDKVEEYYCYKEKCSELGWTEKRFLANLGTPDKIGSNRWGIAVLDSDNAEKFLEHLENCIYTADELREFYSIADEDEKYDFFPSLYVDFDSKVLYSCYPEYMSFENLVPENWTGEYRRFEKFEEFIPENMRYWSD